MGTLFISRSYTDAIMAADHAAKKKNYSALRASPLGPKRPFFLTLGAPAAKKAFTHVPRIAFFAGFVQF